MVGLFREGGVFDRLHPIRCGGGDDLVSRPRSLVPGRRRSRLRRNLVPAPPAPF